MRKACFLSILAGMFEFGLGSFFFHAPIVGKSLAQIGKCLFWRTLGHFVAPGKLLALDLVKLRLQVFHLDAFALCPCFFPASQRPVVGVPANPTGFTKVDLLFWGRIEFDDVRTLHGCFFSCLRVRSNSASISRSKTESIVSCFKAAIALSLRKLSRLILVVTTSCFIGVFYNTFTPCVKQEKQAQDERL